MNILQCPACSLLLVRPYTLRCGHTVCGEHPQTRCPVQQCSFSPQVSAPHLPISPRVAYFPAPQGPPPEESSTSSHSIQGTDVTATRVIHSVRQLEHSDAPEPPRPRKRRKHDPEEVHTDNEEEDLLSHLQVQNALQKTTQPDTPLLSPDLAHPPDAYKTRCERDLLANLTCGICLTLLYRPITTPCQHTFCTKCLHRSLDHSPNCPVCRQELPGFAYFQDAPVNSFLLRISKTIEDEERDGRLNTPIFVCQLSYPGMPTLLHFFEPRYRLMLRRCLESENPSFGMIMPPSPTGPYTSGQPPTLADANYGTMLEIRSVQMLSDGRSMVETWGTHRFRILERGILDGYTVGRIERIDDMEDIPVDLITSDPQPSSADSSSTEKDSSARKSEEPHLLASVLANNERVRTKEELVKICLDFLSRLRAGTAPWVVQRLNNTTDLAGFTFWVGMAIPVDDREKVD
ncbi:PUA-like domain-containing protein [Flagelloscypha sp. PMI_526]|nr:PUA-like domain-containing protein [Flagelloscypha sp. PMI_526]